VNYFRLLYRNPAFDLCQHTVLAENPITAVAGFIARHPWVSASDVVLVINKEIEDLTGAPALPTVASSALDC